MKDKSEKDFIKDSSRPVSNDPKTLVLAAVASGARHIKFLGNPEQGIEAKNVALAYDAKSVSVEVVSDSDQVEAIISNRQPR